MTDARLVDIEVTALEGWELLAAGDQRKLERFGDLLVERPAPQAIWSDAGPFEEAAAVFHRGKEGTGRWITRGTVRQPTRAAILDLLFEIRLTGFGNVGLFPEHTAHWRWMAEHLSKETRPSVLNLFAYTGGASMACARAGARVTHVDSAKAVNNWAEINVKASGISSGSIRFITDDVLKFTKREDRRGRRYHGIIIDPPTFGRGPKGETWKIERDLRTLINACAALLEANPLFVVVTAHSPGVTPAVLRELLSGLGGVVQSGEMLLRGKGASLPAGDYVRWTP
jgi:23S rRNA (cytosine1962-C5)-methyltransferase